MLHSHPAYSEYHFANILRSMLLAESISQTGVPLAHVRPEIQARHTAFKRGSAYLERYCLLIAFTAYLEDCRRRQLSSTFEDWMAARPDLCQARNSILDNPAGTMCSCLALCVSVVFKVRWTCSAMTTGSWHERLY